MKKHLLLVGALLISIVSYAQNEHKTNSPIVSATFTRISGCWNVFSFLNSNSKILNYNRYVNAVSFIHRKSPTYATIPLLPAIAQSGAVVAYIGANGGTQWDSTLVWAHPTNLARYPSGGLYNPMGNHNLNNAYVVVTGPLLSSPSYSWMGSYYASKPISLTPKNSAGSDMQMMSNTSPFSTTTSPTMTKHDYPRFSFTSTDDGIVRVAGSLYEDVNQNSAQFKKYRGGTISKGSFNSGVFVWTIDSFIPPCVVRSDGSKSLHEECWMTWSDAGTHGYLMFIGARQGSSGSNIGWQPIIFKTTNAGNTWALVNSIDFNTATIYDKVLNSLDPVNTNTNLTVPFFNMTEGIDVSVDQNNKLHIFTTVLSTSSAHNDSLNYTRTYTVGTQQYNWPFYNNKWPYLIDFIGDGASSPWLCKIIDSCGTQAYIPAAGPTNTNFPWAGMTYPDPGAGVHGTAMRLQMSRTCYNDYMLYSWAESDTTLTTGTLKWNEFPNIKIKTQRLCDGDVSTNEFSVSNPATGFNPRVKDHAYFHYMSPVSRNGGSSFSQATFTTPITVSNNIPTDPSQPLDNYYSNVVTQFNFQSSACGSSTVICSVGTNIKEFETNNLSYNLYPNPAPHSFSVSVTVADNNNNIGIEVYSLLGQKVASADRKVYAGENIIHMDLKNCAPGIYLVKVKSGNIESTKKLLIE